MLNRYAACWHQQVWWMLPLIAGPGQGQNSSAAAAAAAAGGAGPAEEGEVLYNMTGQTGSLMYMAPEVLLQTPSGINLYSAVLY